MTFGLIPVTIGMLTMLLSAVVPQNNVVDEEGPIVTAVSISPSGYLQVGDVLTVTLTIFDPGGSGVRNIQFSLKDRFERQHSPFNTEDWGAVPTAVFAGGDSPSNVPLRFRVSETWASNGFVVFSNARAYDKKGNGTYFYLNGSFENLQTKSRYPISHPMAAIRVGVGNPEPTNSSPAITSTTTNTTITNTTTSTTATILSTTTLAQPDQTVKGVIGTKCQKVGNKRRVGNKTLSCKKISKSLRWVG